MKIIHFVCVCILPCKVVRDKTNSYSAILRNYQQNIYDNMTKLLYVRSKLVEIGIFSV